MSFKKGSKVVLKANAFEMDLGYDIEHVEAGKVYRVGIKRGKIVFLENGKNFLEWICVETKALTWAA